MSVSSCPNFNPSVPQNKAYRLARCLHQHLRDVHQSIDVAGHAAALTTGARRAASEYMFRQMDSDHGEELDKHTARDQGNDNKHENFHRMTPGIVDDVTE